MLEILYVYSTIPQQDALLKYTLLQLYIVPQNAVKWRTEHTSVIYRRQVYYTGRIQKVVYNGLI